MKSTKKKKKIIIIIIVIIINLSLPATKETIAQPNDSFLIITDSFNPSKFQNLHFFKFVLYFLIFITNVCLVQFFLELW